MIQSSSDTLLIVVPFLIVVVIAVFRLDEAFLKSSARPRRDRPRFANSDQSGRMTLTDPDGRVPHSPNSK